MSDSAVSPLSPLSRLQSLAGRISETRKVGAAVVSVAVDSISPNPQQPRKTFNEAKLQRLADSIRAHGIIQPVILKSVGQSRYELVAGERRWRAAKLAGSSEIPAILRDVQDGTSSLVTALIENLDREDMTPMDEATGVADLATRTSIQEAARLLGHPPQWISKRKRIAEAPSFVLDFVAKGETTDIEALYELAKLASDDPNAAGKIIADYKKGAHLREQIKSAANPAAPRLHGTAPADVLAKSGGLAQGNESPAGSADIAPADSSHANTTEGGTAGETRTRSTRVVQAVLMREGEILLVTDAGKIHLSFTDCRPAADHSPEAGKAACSLSDPGEG